MKLIKPPVCGRGQRENPDYDLGFKEGSEAQLQSDLASQPKPELPLLTDEEIIEASKVNMFYPDGSVDLNKGFLTGRQQVAKAQRDADQKALGTTGVWQEKPDRQGWYARRKPNWNHMEVIRLVKGKIKPEDGVDTETYQWYPIPEPQVKKET